jgi:DNA repair exonuclease SbcCD ATPase subunit
MRKRNAGDGLDEAVNMDVMMDNMTDVVGTLLMVLIIVQLKVNNTIHDIQSNLPKVTQEQVAQAEAATQALKKEMAQVQSQVVAHRPIDEKVLTEIAKKKEQLRLYETTLKQNDVQLLALEKLEKELAEKRKQVEAAKAEAAQLLAEREKLQGLLETKEITVAPPAKIVRMPAAREIPAGAELTRVLCANQEIYIVDTTALRKIALSAFSFQRKALVKEIGTIVKGVDTTLYDHEKTAAALNKRKLGNSYFELMFPVVKTQDRLRMEIRPKEKTGEKAEDLGDFKSQFSTLLRTIKKNPKGVIWFAVYKDSLETYLAAREVCDRNGVPAGWEMTGSPFFVETLTEFKVNRLEEPAKAAADALIIPAPKKTID